MNPLLTAATSGFLLGGSLIIAIGAQNAFVLRQGLLRSHVFVVCLICALSDALLIAAGVAGLGTLLSRTPVLITAVTLGGAVFLAYYAWLALKRMRLAQSMPVDATSNPDLRRAVATCLAFTFLNPHVYLDTVLLIGSLSARHEGTGRLAYGIGAVIASFVWFFGLGYGARVLQPVFEKPVAWRVLDGLIALVMGGLALGLLGRLVAAP